MFSITESSTGVNLSHSLPSNIYASVLPLASGTASDGSTTTLIDASKSWTTNQWAGYRLSITSGAAAGDYIEVLSNNATTLTLNNPSNNGIISGNTYVICGQEMNLYPRNCRRTRKAGDIFDYKFATSKGTVLDECWRFTPADSDVSSGNTSTVDASVDVYLGGSKVLTKSASLHIAKSTAGPNATTYPEQFDNPDFESALVADPTLGWQWNGAGTSATIDTNQKHGGSSSLRLDGVYALVIQKCTLPASTQYTFSIYTRKSVAGYGSKIGFRYGSTYLQNDLTTWNSTANYVLDLTSDPADTWVLHTITFTTSSSGSTNVEVMLNNFSTSGTGPVWYFDDASLKQSGTIKGNRNVLFIGDSVGVGPLSELVTLFGLDTSMGITMRGPIDAGGGVKHACYAGMPWSGLALKSSWDHPFATGVGADFDFSQWSGYSDLTVDDWVFIHLGLNSTISQTASTFQSYLSTSGTQIDAIISSILESVPGIRIGLQCVIPSASQDGWGYNYRTSLQYATSADFIERFREWFISRYDTNAQIANGVHIVPYHCNLDVVNNMINTSATVNVNARNSTVQVTRPFNAVHPGTSGYKQLADSMYAFLKYMQ